MILPQVGLTMPPASRSPLASLACWACELTSEEKEAVVKVIATLQFLQSFYSVYSCQASSEANLDLTHDWRGREEELLEELMPDFDFDLPDLKDMEM